MEANSLLTAEPIEKVRFKRGCRAVYDADGKLLCGIHKKAIYDLNGNKIADYDRTETREEVRKGETVRYEILHYAGENTAFRAENGYLYRGEELLGRIAPKDKRMAILAAALAFACIIFAVSITFTALMGYAEAPDTYPTLTLSDKDGVWGANAELDIFGEEPIAPGASGEYIFLIENPTNVRLQYTINLAISRKGEPISFPFDYTLKMNNLIVAEGDGRGALAVGDILFEKESNHRFSLAWEWPAEGNDGEDTEIGSAGGEITLTITVTAQIAEESGV